MRLRRILPLFVVLGVVLVALSGCELFEWLQPDDPITLKLKVGGVSKGTLVQSYPDYALGGLEVEFLVSGGNQKRGYEISYGDGASDASPTELSASAYTFTHTYAQAGSFPVVVTSGRTSKDARVVVYNNDPVIYPVWYWVGLHYRQLVRLDARPLEHGCDHGTGSALFLTGIWDDDIWRGDKIRYRVSVTGPSPSGQSVSYTIWNRVGEIVNGQWLSIDEVAYFQVGISGPDCSVSPPFDYASLDAKACPPGGGGDQGEILVPTGEKILFVYEAIDLMTPPERAIRTEWLDDYHGGGCSSTCDE